MSQSQFFVNPKSLPDQIRASNKNLSHAYIQMLVCHLLDKRAIGSGVRTDFQI